MNHSIYVTSEPAVEPLTTSEVKTAARIDYDAEDTIVASWIKSGRALAESVVNMAFITQTLRLAFDGWPAAPFYLPRPPLQSVTSFKYYGTDNTEYSLTSGTDFYSEIYKKPGRIDLVYGTTWPTTTLREMDSVVITYVAGFGAAATAVPEWAKDAIILYCTYRHENRAGEIDKIPEAFFNILRPHRIRHMELDAR